MRNELKFLHEKLAKAQAAFITGDKPCEWAAWIEVADLERRIKKARG